MSKVKKVILDVPYISQVEDVDDSSWHRKACGPVALAMVLNFYSLEVDPNKIIKEGEVIGGYVEGIGWRHTSLLAVARNHGLNAYNQEFRAVNVDLERMVFKKSEFDKRFLLSGLVKIANFLNNGKPVIVSVSGGFFENESSHLVVLTGFREKNGKIMGFYFNDPLVKSGDGKSQFTKMDRFISHWRKMALFISRIAN